jgi:hypothetical protein
MLSMTQTAVGREHMKPTKSRANARPGWLGWVPLAVLPAAVCLFRARMLAWEFMWLLSAAIFLRFKWETWFRAHEARRRASVERNLGYLFLWPGMDAPKFLATVPAVSRPQSREWLAALAKTALGISLIVFVARRPPSTNGLLAGWLGMLGIVLFLHFGLFHLASLIWRRAGVDAQPIMRSPLSSVSLSEFWGKRWNLGFRQLTHTLIYQPLLLRAGPSIAILSAFAVSGIIHDLVISFPAHGGYGFPTAYFLLQGFAVLLEKSPIGRRLGIGRGHRGWLFVLICAGAPAFWLFHPLFISTVMLPFFAYLGEM